MSTSAATKLTAETRTGAGKGVARALRREGKIPGVLYTGGKDAVSLALVLNEVSVQHGKGRFKNRVIELQLDGKPVKVLPKDVQFHPVTDVIEHVDFLKIEAGTSVRVAVPVKFLGTEKSIGLKRGGVLNVVRHDIEFMCKPESIPTHIEINIQELDIGAAIHIKDIKLPEGITPVIKRNFTVATIAGRSADEEAKPAEAAAAAAPAAGAAAAPAAAAKKDEKKK